MKEVRIDWGFENGLGIWGYVGITKAFSGVLFQGSIRAILRSSQFQGQFANDCLVALKPYIAMKT